MVEYAPIIVEQEFRSLEILRKIRNLGGERIPLFASVNTQYAGIEVRKFIIHLCKISRKTFINSLYKYNKGGRN